MPPWSLLGHSGTTCLQFTGVVISKLAAVVTLRKEAPPYVFLVGWRLWLASPGPGGPGAAQGRMAQGVRRVAWCRAAAGSSGEAVLVVTVCQVTDSDTGGLDGGVRAPGPWFGRQSPEQTQGKPQSFPHQPRGTLRVEAQEVGKCLSEMNATLLKSVSPRRCVKRTLCFPAWRNAQQSCWVQLVQLTGGCLLRAASAAREIHSTTQGCQSAENEKLQALVMGKQKHL